jgi:hypothetical protein
VVKPGFSYALAEGVFREFIIASEICHGNT